MNEVADLGEGDRRFGRVLFRQLYVSDWILHCVSFRYFCVSLTACYIHTVRVGWLFSFLTIL